MKSESSLFFTEIDFCKLGVVHQGFDLNFNLYLLVFLKIAKLSNNSLISFKNISVEQLIFVLRFSVFHSNRRKNNQK